ncbi:MAG: protein kinase, partial [Chloroflexi bacterium]|nr:protein kinase [Chloroflexota bacterium]
MDNLTGKVIKSYELRNLIGAGGFGAVYLAHQDSVEREVAIKIIWPAFANHPNFIRRFESEAKLVARLEHPHIVPLYDYWRDPEGAYLVMRLLRGHLRQAMQAGPWALEDIARLLSQIGAALTIAHRYGAVHRDIKPENILLDEEGNAYLADFGIAQILRDVHSEDGSEFPSMGSPAYAAPEQLVGETTKPQADIYSLGVVLYELLTAQPPFPEIADISVSKLVAYRQQTRLTPLDRSRPDLPPLFNEIIQRATTLDPDARYPDALTLTAAFHEAITLSIRQALPGGPLRPTDSSARIAVADYLLTPEPQLDILPNPYKGLRAFQEVDAANFYGRELLTDQLVKRLGERAELARFLAVVGPSGSGKSSVIKAGVIPALRMGGLPNSEHWFYVEMVPGNHPFQELTAALLSVAVDPPENLHERLREHPRGLVDSLPEILPPDDKTELFLFIDQFEETFTLVEDEEESRRFLDSLYIAMLDPDSRLRLVLTLRADFYDRPLLYPHMSELLRKRTEVVVPLTPDELERAIVAPAHQIGIVPEPGLVADIIADVNEQPGALPLLQYLLSELFERRSGNLLTLATYRDIGGVRGALASRAEQIFSGLTFDQQEATRQLFLRLITLGEGTEDTRRRTLLDELTSVAEDRLTIDSVIDILGKSRLLTFDRDPITRGPTVEVTHEAILREWVRLRTWLDASREDVRMQRSLAALTAEWLEAQRDSSFLLRGARLFQFEKWADATDLALTRQESEFLKASVNERRLRETQEIQRKEREEQLERRARTRLRWIVVLMTIATIIGFILTGLTFDRSRVAETARATSDANAILSQSLALQASASQAFDDNNGDLAVVLALQANETLAQPPNQSQRALAEVAFAPGTRRVFAGQLSDITSMDISPDGSRIVAGSRDPFTRMLMWDAASGEALFTFDGHRGDLEDVAFSPDGRSILSGDQNGLALLWDAATGALVHTLDSHSTSVNRVMFSPDGRQALTTADERGDDPAAPTIILWDVASGSEIRRFDGHIQTTALTDGELQIRHSDVLAAAFSPNGTRLLTGARDSSIILWDVTTGSELWRVTVGADGDGGTEAESVEDLAFGPDGLTAASASRDEITLWTLDDSMGTRTFTGRSGNINAIAFHPNGQWLLSGTNDNLIDIWDITGSEVLYQLEGHTGAITSVAITRDGQLFASSSSDNTVRLWNFTDPRALHHLASHEARITGLAFDPLN